MSLKPICLPKRSVTVGSHVGFMLLVTMLIALLLDHVNAQQRADGKNVLIVYLSRTKNTKAVAEMIHKAVGGTLVALEVEKAYPENYKAIVDQVVSENETGYLPPLKTKIDHIEAYAVIYIGFPTWGMTLPPPLKSFLTHYNLNGKTVIPFNTNAGYGTGDSFETVKKLCPGSTLLEGFSTRGGVERDGILFVMQGQKAVTVQADVQKWLRKIKMLD